MLFHELVQNLIPGRRIKISFTNMETDGGWIWSKTLTDAQILAYWTHEVKYHQIEDKVV